MFKKILLVLVMSLTLTSCSSLFNTAEKTEKKLAEKYLDLKTYEAETNITYISSDQKTTFKTLQQANIDGRYRIEVIEPTQVSGSVTVFDGTKIYQFNEKVSKDIYVSTTENLERSEIFLTSFLKNYNNSDDVAVTVGTFNDSLYTILEANIGTEHPLIATEKLWINNETKLPEKLVIYDKNEVETIVVEYTTFEYNKELDENLFNVQVK